LQSGVFADGTISDSGANIYTGELTSVSNKRVEVLVSASLAGELEVNDVVKLKFSEAGKLFSGEIDKVGSSLTQTQSASGYLVTITADKIPDSALNGVSVSVDFSDSKYVVATLKVSEYDLHNVASGQTATLTLLSTGGVTDAKVISIGRLADVSSGVVKFDVKLRFKAGDELIIEGMSVAAKVFTSEAKSVLTIPTSAVTEANGKTQVQVLVDSLPTNITVELGLESDGYVEVISGLTSGDLVITGSTATGQTGSNGFMPPAPDQFGGN
jgi:cobalt-zinc-cadmium efflux system membrane fusion protein